MAQSQGYKRFRSSINTIYHGTSTPQTSNSNRIFPRASTPNSHRKDKHVEQTIPVVRTPHSKVTVHDKVQKKPRHSHRRYQIYVDHIVFIQQQQKSCSHCHCKKRKSQHILGVL
ncbi:unnamed protein product [Adineta ricciae]|uniref:Uncharacterized protein n=1 Tax=Adineta ricciae TaxID=249248 RepID=A0A814CUP1_ADIRI|nr:unnamed protein product [Adineta ricciae]